MRQRPRPARGVTAQGEPDKLRRAVARLHDLTDKQAALLEGRTYNQLVASARRIKAGNPPGTSAGNSPGIGASSTFVDEDGRTYDGGGEPVDGDARQMIADALANQTRRHTRIGTGQRSKATAEDPDERRIRLEERLGDALATRPGRARREQRLEQLLAGPEDPDDRRARIEARLTDIYDNHDLKDAA